MLVNILGWINMILFSIVTIPQIIKTIKLKKADDVSILVYWIIVIANIDALIYAILINQLPLVAKYIFGLITAIIYMLVYYRVQRKNK